MNVWIGAGIAVVAGLVVGTIAGRVTQAWMSRENNPDVMKRIAPSIGSLVFSLILIIGLMTALGMVQRESLDQISADFVDFVPKVISGAIVIIAANVLGQFAQQALERTLSRLPGSAARNIPNITRLVIFAFGAILAAAQLGIDTSIINIAVAALLFSLGAAMALMIGLGSRAVTAEVAAGRAVRRLLNPGDEVHVQSMRGTIVSLDTVAVELVDERGVNLVVPHSTFMENTFEVTRASAPDAGEPETP